MTWRRRAVKVHAGNHAKHARSCSSLPQQASVRGTPLLRRTGTPVRGDHKSFARL